MPQQEGEIEPSSLFPSPVTFLLLLLSVLTLLLGVIPLSPPNVYFGVAVEGVKPIFLVPSGKELDKVGVWGGNFDIFTTTRPDPELPYDFIARKRFYFIFR